MTKLPPNVLSALENAVSVEAKRMVNELGAMYAVHGSPPVIVCHEDGRTVLAVKVDGQWIAFAAIAYMAGVGLRIMDLSVPLSRVASSETVRHLNLLQRSDQDMAETNANVTNPTKPAAAIAGGVGFAVSTPTDAGGRAYLPNPSFPDVPFVMGEAKARAVADALDGAEVHRVTLATANA